MAAYPPSPNSQKSLAPPALRTAALVSPLAAQVRHPDGQTSLWCCRPLAWLRHPGVRLSAAATCIRPRQSCPPTPAGLVIGLRPTVGSRKVVPTLQAIDGTDPSGGRWGGRWERSLGRRGRGPIVWREATKNFASKAVQRQQGEELLRVSGKLDILLPLSALYLLLPPSS